MKNQSPLQEIHKKGNKVGWYFFKVVPNPNNPSNQKADFDYVIFNFYKDNAARKAGWGVEVNDAFIKKSNYGKMKSSEINRLLYADASGYTRNPKKLAFYLPVFFNPRCRIRS